jgi:hypothetical protein
MPSKKTAAFAISIAVLLAQARATEFDLSWHTIDCGGGASAGSVFTVSGSIAQPDAAVMTGGVFTIVGGFWAAPPIPCTQFIPADCNCDGVIDNGDIAAFALALVDQLAYETAHPACNRLCVSDLNLDGETDGLDVGLFVNCRLIGCQ